MNAPPSLRTDLPLPEDGGPVQAPGDGPFGHVAGDARRWARLLAWHLTTGRIVRFGIVGLSGVVVNLGLLYVLHGRLGLHDLVAVPIAVEASIVSNFLLNDRFTFRDRHQGSRAWRAAKFNAIALAALLVNLATYAVLTKAFGVHYLVAEAGAIVVAFGGNYAGNLLWTYAHSP